jgi:anti-sigma factor ChrR (cupin superfamily)
MAHPSPDKARFTGDKGRKVINIRETPFQPYDMEGPVQKDMSVIKLHYDHQDRQGAYLIRMEPGAETIAHEHPFREDFLILEGELIESDGTVLKAGDFVMYDPGTYHNSRTEKGCLLLGIDWQRQGLQK